MTDKSAQEALYYKMYGGVEPVIDEGSDKVVVDGVEYETLKEGAGLPLDKKVIVMGGAQYGKSPVGDAVESVEAFAKATEHTAKQVEILSGAFAKATDAEMMELYEETHVTKETTMGNFPLSKLKTATTVPLMEATQLYQPVEGTSSGSRYFALAIGPDLRVAGRWHTGTSGGHGLALRVEGPGLDDEETKALIVECGLDFKSPKHASAHLSSKSEIDIRKACGALLMGLGAEWSTAMPNPQVIKGL